MHPGDGMPEERWTHRTAYGPANTARGYGSTGRPERARRPDGFGPGRVAADRRPAPSKNAGSTLQPPRRTLAGGTVDPGAARAPRTACHCVQSLGRSRPIVAVRWRQHTVRVGRQRRPGGGQRQRGQRLGGWGKSGWLWARWAMAVGGREEKEAFPLEIRIDSNRRLQPKTSHDDKGGTICKAVSLVRSC